MSYLSKKMDEVSALRAELAKVKEERDALKKELERDSTEDISAMVKPMVDGLKAEIAALTQSSKGLSLWIDVNERLPDKIGSVLIWHCGKLLRAYFYLPDQGFWINGQQMFPTHWQPLPEGPA